MARTGLRSELVAAIPLALKRGRAVACRQVEVRVEGQTHLIDVSVNPLQEPERLRGLLLIVFTEQTLSGATAPKSGAKSKPAAPALRLRGVQLELREVRDENVALQSEMRAAQQEASSAYEELQSINEEAQSTNEELMTSKEELQSMNEELQTINHELQAKMAEMTRLNNDMRNLLANSEITSVFLDANLRIRLFTAGSTRILRLIPGDVGRPITDIVSDLLYPDLTDDARTVLKTLEGVTRQVPTNDGREFRIRMMPYRTIAGTVDGVVVSYDEQAPKGTTL